MHSLIICIYKQHGILFRFLSHNDAFSLLERNPYIQIHVSLLLTKDRPRLCLGVVYKAYHKQVYVNGYVFGII